MKKKDKLSALKREVIKEAEELIKKNAQELLNKKTQEKQPFRDLFVGHLDDGKRLFIWMDNVHVENPYVYIEFDTLRFSFPLPLFSEFIHVLSQANDKLRDLPPNLDHVEDLVYYDSEYMMIHLWTGNPFNDDYMVVTISLGGVCFEISRIIFPQFIYNLMIADNKRIEITGE